MPRWGACSVLTAWTTRARAPVTGACPRTHTRTNTHTCAQITQDYQPGVLHRPDLSLVIYGFVLKLDPPLLAVQVRASAGRR